MLKSRYKEHRLSKDDYRRIIAVKKLLPDMTILVDVGCSDGTITRILGYGKKADIIGLELSKEAAHRAKKKIDNVIICDIEESLPFKDESVDCIFAGEIVEHLFDPDYFFAESKRVLKKEGCLIVTTPNLAGLGSRLALLLGRKPWMIEEKLKDEYAGHIRYFTISTLKKIIESNGLIVDKVTSDGIKFGKVVSVKLGQIMPELGLHIIIKAYKK